ncbi:Telomerase reverse transcriptase [Folsomia candida]|uniref:Telomerase reverse transcriptase n=1 Tax=Folsomia candida TaxID=158441 RepID=A0A226EVD5_FOLCA|nr:Telomerase reverse transcriptase [Folsomia candida]
MEYLRTRLQEVTGHQLDVTPIFEFLHSFSLGLSQATKARVEEFECKWKAQPYCKQLILAYILGSWKPHSAARTAEIISQRTWDDYANQVYQVTSVTSSCTSTIGPFTFREMIQHEFWKDLYDAFGQKVVAFVLDKALIIFEVESQFYLLIAAEGSTLHQKIAKAPIRPVTRSGGGPRITSTKSFNPYTLNENDIISQVDQVPKVAPVEISRPQLQKRKRRISTDQQDRDGLAAHFHKKVKISATIDYKRAEPLFSHRNSEKQISSKEAIGQNTKGLIRWFKPTQKILHLLLETREALKKTSGIPPSITQPPRPEDAMTQLHFVGIMENQEFGKIARLNVVHKQYRPLDFKKPIHISGEWEGLVIKEPETRSSDRKYNVNVYRISEDFARKNNIRVNRKQRRGRKYPSESYSSSPISIQTLEKTNIAHPLPLPPALPIDCFYTKDDDADHYNPLMTLSTLPALYNKGSWSRWPHSHILTIVSSKPLKEATLLLLEDILGTDVGAPMYDTRISINDFPENCLLWDILKKLIMFHKRAHNDIHKLVKRCITYWMIKLQEKFSSKQNKANQKKGRQRFEHGNIVSSPQKNSPETIDLATGSKFMLSSELTTTGGGRGNQLIIETSILCTTSDGTNNQNSSEILQPSNKEPVKTASGQEIKRPAIDSKLKERIPHSCILMTLRHILHLSGLEVAIGSKKNLRNFHLFVRKSIILAGTKSSLQLGQMMSQLDPSTAFGNWMPLDMSSSTRSCLFAKIVTWIFTTYLMTVLKTSFYVTEMNTSRLHACFYLRESWKSISESVLHRLVKSGTLGHVAKLPMKFTAKADQRRFLQGINSRIRFLPKMNNDMRPIISLYGEARNKWDEKNAKLLIDYIVRTKSPHRLRDTNVLRQRWLKFLGEWQRQNRPKLYFVRGDIQNAYPSVNITKLKRILENLTPELGTLTRKEFKVFSKTRAMYRKVIICWKRPEMWTDSIFARPCLVQHNDSHGWVLSEGYCNLYYGQMDAEYFFRFLNNNGEFFNTSIDDYLYITPNPKRAAKFLDKLRAGVSRFNCKFNANKMSTNIYPTIHWPISRQDCEWVTFCGWCFCLTCGHIMRDFSAYAGQDMASSISFIPWNVTSPENFLVARMKVMLPARLHHFILDPSINCRSRIVLNILEAGLVFAFRFYAICRVIYPNLSALKYPKRAKQSISAIIVCAGAVSR